MCNCIGTIDRCPLKPPFCVFKLDGVYELACDHHCIHTSKREKRFDIIMEYYVSKGFTDIDWKIKKYYADIISNRELLGFNDAAVQCICTAHIKFRCYIEHIPTNQVFLIGGHCLFRISNRLSKEHNESIIRYKHKLKKYTTDLRNLQHSSLEKKMIESEMFQKDGAN